MREAFGTFNREGVAALTGLLDPALEVHPFPEWPGRQFYRGIEGLCELVEEWTENFDHYRWDVQRLIDAGERVVYLHTKLVGTRARELTSSSR